MVATVDYAGIALDAGPYHLLQVTGLAGGADVRTSDRPRLARHGLVAGTDYLGGRAIGIDLEVSSFDDAEFDAAVSALLRAFAPGGIQAPLTFHIRGIAGGQVARILVRPRRLSAPVTTPWFKSDGVVSVELFSVDPLIYSNAQYSISLVLGLASTGLVWPLTWPLSWGSTSGDFGVTIQNDGNAYAPVVITITGPVVNPRVENVSTGQVIALTGTLADGEFLVIDTQARTILLGGTASRYSWLTVGDWWGLAPGPNQVRFAASTATSATATVVYRSAWL